MKRIIVCLLVLLSSSLCFAANETTTSPMRIDTFGADVSISTSPIKIKNIVVTAYTSAKTVTFIDADAAVVLVLECPAGATISWPSVGGDFRNSGMLFTRGFIFDDSASDLAANDCVFIWVQ